MLALSPLALRAQQQELGFTLGTVLSGERSASGGTLDIGNGIALQANYAYRLWKGNAGALYADAHLLASPLREISTALPSSSRDFATLYVTPGLKWKFNPDGRLQPYLLAGAGWALYEQSTLRLDGAPNDAPRTLNRGVFTYGGGGDIRALPWLGFRGEFRTFYSGNPAFNVPGVSAGQNNRVLSGGVVLRFGS